MKSAFRLLVIGFVLTLALSPGLVLAQGLDQLLEWAEQGFSMAYPAGWVGEAIDSETYALFSNPADSLDNPPTAPAVVVVAFGELLGAMGGSPTEALNAFLQSEGGDLPAGVAVASTSFAGYEAARVSYTDTAENLHLDVVILTAESNAFLVIGAAPPGQESDFTPIFEAMLNTVTISAPAGGPVGGPPMVGPLAEVPVDGVRITLDQTITGSWNEIDAVELIGTDSKGNELAQYATGAEATSQYGDDSWSAMQATGAPDTFECGDIRTAWASATSTGQDTLTLYYDTAVTPTAVNIHQTYNPGAIVMVELLPADDSLPPIVVFEGVDSTVACPGVFAIQAGGGGALAYGDVVTGEITDAAYYQDWTFEGAQGDVVTITMVDTSPSDDLDPYLYLLDADGNELASNDDADDPLVGFLNAQIVGFTLPYSGPYTIRATRFGEGFGSSVGSYELRLETGTGGGLQGEVTGALAYGETVSGEITADTFFQNWTFEGAQGDVVTITMIDTSPDDGLDPLLHLVGPDGNVLITNDDADDSSIGLFNAQIVAFTLPLDGTYTIRATRFGEGFGSSVGSYELTLQVAPGGGSK